MVHCDLHLGQLIDREHQYQDIKNDLLVCSIQFSISFKFWVLSKGGGEVLKRYKELAVGEALEYSLFEVGFLAVDEFLDECAV